MRTGLNELLPPHHPPQLWCRHPPAHIVEIDRRFAHTQFLQGLHFSGRTMTLGVNREMKFAHAVLELHANPHVTALTGRFGSEELAEAQVGSLHPFLQLKPRNAKCQQSQTEPLSAPLSPPLL